MSLPISLNTFKLSITRILFREQLVEVNQHITSLHC